MFTHVEEKDLLKLTNDCVWRGPVDIKKQQDKKYVCQSDCVLLQFGYKEVPKERTKILEGFSSKKDRDSDQLYVDFVEKYIRPQSASLADSA